MSAADEVFSAGNTEHEVFREKIRAALNFHSVDTLIEVPDFILAGYVIDNLRVRFAERQRLNQWEGRDE